ncbi:hypothetical protein E2C01_016304 [Portunus trituberculatus]|uniref:Secreted protein n=1 Tax=Portunus trituberculatus TaxID=210409 RepID=A0A5B7DQF1_PORTR|nr:hypothetical protein [Portunus trituberculatus]
MVLSFLSTLWGAWAGLVDAGASSDFLSLFLLLWNEASLGLDLHTLAPKLQLGVDRAMEVPVLGVCVEGGHWWVVGDLLTHYSEGGRGLARNSTERPVHTSSGIEKY